MGILNWRPFQAAREWRPVQAAREWRPFRAARAGKPAQRTGTFACARCGNKVRALKGEKLPVCACGGKKYSQVESASSVEVYPGREAAP